VWLRTAAVEIAQELGDPSAAVTALLATLDMGDVSARELNDAAWTLLFVPGQSAKALELVERSTKMNGASTNARHTLAMAQLENGKISAAFTSLRDEVGRRGDVALLPDVWWLVRGRLAEAYGLKDQALAAYKRVPTAPGPHHFDATSWAADRIKALK
jgi:hypothetical protein